MCLREVCQQAKHVVIRDCLLMPFGFEEAKPVTKGQLDECRMFVLPMYLL